MAHAVTTVPVAAAPVELEREPLVANRRSVGWISDQIAGVAEGKTPWWWWGKSVWVDAGRKCTLMGGDVN